MFNRITVFGFTSVLAVCIAATTGCSRGYHFSGVVLDGNAAPIPGAKIFVVPHQRDVNLGDFSQASANAVSQDNGEFEASYCCTPGYDYFLLITSCDGYLDDVRIVSAETTGIRVVLAYDSDDHASAAN